MGLSVQPVRNPSMVPANNQTPAAPLRVAPVASPRLVQAPVQQAPPPRIAPPAPQPAIKQPWTTAVADNKIYAVNNRGPNFNAVQGSTKAPGSILDYLNSLPPLWPWLDTSPLNDLSGVPLGPPADPRSLTASNQPKSITEQVGNFVPIPSPKFKNYDQLPLY